MAKKLVQDAQLLQLPRNNDRAEMGKWIPASQVGKVNSVFHPDIEQQISRIENEYEDREELSHFGLQHKQRALFFGPPGTGKSFAARGLASSLKLPLFIIPCASLFDSHLGDTGRNLQSLFEFLEKTPCVALIDECDSIVSARSGGDGSGAIRESNRIVNTVLQLLEMTVLPGIVVFTTNFEGSLDFALFRRFDSVVRFENPGPVERRLLIENTLGKMLPKQLGFSALTESSDGLSAAMLIAACQEAMKTSLLKCRREVSIQEVDVEIRSIKAMQDQFKNGAKAE